MPICRLNDLTSQKHLRRRGLAWPCFHLLFALACIAVFLSLTGNKVFRPLFWNTFAHGWSAQASFQHLKSSLFQTRMTITFYKCYNKQDFLVFFLVTWDVTFCGITRGPRRTAHYVRSKVERSRACAFLAKKTKKSYWFIWQCKWYNKKLRVFFFSFFSPNVNGPIESLTHQLFQLLGPVYFPGCGSLFRTHKVLIPGGSLIRKWNRVC